MNLHVLQSIADVVNSELGVKVLSLTNDEHKAIQFDDVDNVTYFQLEVDEINSLIMLRTTYFDRIEYSTEKENSFFSSLELAKDEITSILKNKLNNLPKTN